MRAMMAGVLDVGPDCDGYEYLKGRATPGGIPRRSSRPSSGWGRL